MGFKDYISSGILELYVLGETTPAESRQVEAFARQYPQVTEELRAIQAALLSMGQANARQPAPSLKKNILEKIEKSTPHAGNANDIALFAGLTPYLLSVLLALALAGLAWFFLQNQKKQQQYDEVQAILQQLRTNCDSIRQAASQMNRYIAVVENPSTQPVVLTGLDKAPDAMAVVYYNPKEQKIFLKIKNLPPPPPGRQYQLWGIVDGKPIDMGAFDIPNQPLHLRETPFTGHPQAFAVTLEKQGGSSVPTLDQMYLMGKI